MTITATATRPTVGEPSLGAFIGDLHPHQQEALDFLTDTPRALLADEVIPARPMNRLPQIGTLLDRGELARPTLRAMHDRGESHGAEAKARLLLRFVWTAEKSKLAGW